MTLFKHNGGVLPCADELAEQAMKDYGIPGDAERLVITEEEWLEGGAYARIIDGKIFVGKTDAEKLSDAQEITRARRDRLLSREVDPVQSRRLYWDELGEEKRAAWAAYRRALLDVPEQAVFQTDPLSVEWPKKPE